MAFSQKYNIRYEPGAALRLPQATMKKAFGQRAPRPLRADFFEPFEQRVVKFSVGREHATIRGERSAV